MSWDMLVCSIPHRDAELRELLAVLDEQWQPGAGVIVYRDNLEAGYGDKCQALVDASTADYVSFLDDDDLVAPDFIPEVMDALGQRPDYVGFQVRYTVDGVRGLPVDHSLRHGRWNTIDERPPVLIRDIVHLNPIRRELALLGRWEEPGWQADYRWASQVRGSGQCRTEVYVARELYYKQDRSAGDFRRRPQPFPPGTIPPLPSYPWLRSL